MDFHRDVQCCKREYFRDPVQSRNFRLIVIHYLFQSLTIYKTNNGFVHTTCELTYEIQLLLVFRFEMSSTSELNTRTEGDGQRQMIIFVLYLLKFCIFLYFSEPQHHIPPLVPVTHDARELWEDVDIYIQNYKVSF